MEMVSNINGKYKFKSKKSLRCICLHMRCMSVNSYLVIFTYDFIEKCSFRFSYWSQKALIMVQVVHKSVFLSLRISKQQPQNNNNLVNSDVNSNICFDIYFLMPYIFMVYYPKNIISIFIKAIFDKLLSISITDTLIS